MDAKKILIVTVLGFSVSLESVHAAMPFGRLMPLHYGRGDIRTVVVARTDDAAVSSSLPSMSLGRTGHPQDRQGS